MRLRSFTLGMLMLGIMLFAPGTRAQDARVLAQAQRVSGDRFAFATRTPRGARVFAVRTPNSATLNAIDRGLTELFAAARRSGYRSRLRHSDYTIFIARADRTNDAEGRYSPGIAIGSAQYAGTVFDKGGYMYVAGMVLSNEPAAMIVPEHTRNYELLADYVRYEGEHLVLYHNDRRRYAQTADHSRGGSHPILQ